MDYIIATNGRTGSSYYCNLLKINGAGQPWEHYHPKEGFSAAIAEGKTTEEYTALRRQQFTVNGIYGVKIMPGHVQLLWDNLRGEKPETPTDILKLLFPAAKYIFLSRQDTIRQALSYWRCWETGQWWRKTGERIADPAIPLDCHKVDQHWQWVQNSEKFWRDAFERLQISYLPVVYEDLIREPLEVVRRSLTFLGLPEPDGGIKDFQGSELTSDERTEQHLEVYGLWRAAKDRARRGMRVHECAAVVSARPECPWLYVPIPGVVPFLGADAAAAHLQRALHGETISTVNTVNSGQCMRRFSFTVVVHPLARLVRAYLMSVGAGTAEAFEAAGLKKHVVFYPNMPFADFARAVCGIPDFVAEPVFRSQHFFLRESRTANLPLKVLHWEDRAGAEPVLEQTTGVSMRSHLGLHDAAFPADYLSFYDDELRSAVCERYKGDLQELGYPAA